MSIKLELSPDLRCYTDNQRSFEVVGDTVGECLDYLARRFPDLKMVMYAADGKLAEFVVRVYIKGTDSEPWDLSRPVKDGDEIVLALGGG